VDAIRLIRKVFSGTANSTCRRARFAKKGAWMCAHVGAVCGQKRIHRSWVRVLIYAQGDPDPDFLSAVPLEPSGVDQLNRDALADRCLHVSEIDCAAQQEIAALRA
jgi:hypothetical protein